MQFQILGPCEVYQDGRPLPLGGVKQRALLAALLLDAGRVVPADRLIDDLWGEEAPIQARHNLQELISQLRKTLRTAASGQRIITRAPGYRIELAPGELDLHRFEGLASEGRELFSAGDMATAAVKIAEALGLWKGPPLAELAFEGFAQQEIARLEELRMSVIEERIAVDLALGRHADVVGELQSLVSANPLRERLREQLMLALYRSGRQAESLDAYRETREVLTEELGLDPSPALQRMEAAILSHDPALDLPRAEESRPKVAPDVSPSLDRRLVPSTRLVRKTVTIIFSDLTGSTGLGERLDPEAMRHVMDRYFDEMRAVIERHGGTVEKSLGDSLMAVFGIPTVHEDDALRAVRAVAEMREALARLNEELERDRGMTLATRTGVHTGEVVAGDPSAGERPVIGDAVNVAARLEQSAQPGEILLGRTTHRLVRDAVRADPIEPLMVKGKSQPVPAFRLLGVTPGAPGQIRHLDAPMVGRDRELASLRQAFDRVQQEQACHLFTVFGSAGIGKSRLIEEFISAVEQSARVVKGRCLAYGEGITFWPITEIVRQAAAINERDTIDQTQTKIASLLVRLDDGALVAERITQMMGLSRADVSPGETFRSVRRLFECLADDRPAVVVIEDVHWAEPTLLDLIENIADWSRDASVQLICTARLELLDERTGWGGGKPNAASVLLAPLSEEETNTLIDHRLGEVRLPSEAMSPIREVAGGNPLFIEELLSSLIEEGNLVEDGGQWTARNDLRDLVIPPSIQALLAARLDRLDAVERRVIEAAAVVGKEFGVAAVEYLVADVDVEGQLMTLAKRELVRPDRAGRDEDRAYRFRHVLIRDAAYDSITKEARADLHERLGDWMQATTGERLGEVEEIFGYHLERAYRYRSELGPVDDHGRELAQRAGEAMASAGHRAFTRGDMSAVVSLFSVAADLLPAHDLRLVQLLPDLGAALVEIGRLDRAEMVLADAINSATTFEDLLSKASALYYYFELRRWTHGETDMPSLHEAELLVPILEMQGNDAALARCWRVLSAAPDLSWRERRDRIERSLAHARSAGDRRWELEVLQNLSNSIIIGPLSLEEAIESCDRYLAIAKGDRVAEAAIRVIARARLLAMAGRFDEARSDLASARATFDELGLKLWSAAQGAIGPARVEILAGDSAAAERELRRGVAALEEMGVTGWDLEYERALLADTLTEQGRLDEAEELIRSPNEFPTHKNLTAWRQETEAKILARRGHFEDAERLARVAVGIPDDENVWWKADALMTLAEILGLEGKTGEAVTAVYEAKGLYEQMGHVVGLGRARVALAELQD